jgi:hypothetical protein
MQWFPVSVDLSPHIERFHSKSNQDAPLPFLSGDSSASEFEIRQFDLRNPSEIEKVTNSMRCTISENQKSCFGPQARDLLLPFHTYLFLCFKKGQGDSPVASLVVKENVIWNFCVQEQFQGQGIGGLMLKAVISFFQQNKAIMKPCQLYVRQDNVRAQNFYLKHGFKFVRKPETGQGSLSVSYVGDTSEPRLLVQNAASSFVEFLMQYQ